MSLWEYLWAGSGTTKGLYHYNGDNDDDSWNGNDWTPYNLSYVGGKIWSWCASFNWINAYHSLWTWDIWIWWNLTISLWIYFYSSDSVMRILSDWDASGRNILFYMNDYKVYARTWNGSTLEDNVILEGTIDILKWHNIVYTRDWTIKKLYINWELKDSYTWWYSWWVTTSQAKSIWNNPQSNIAYLDWKIDEVILENTAWSADKVKKQYTYSKWYYALL